MLLYPNLYLKNVREITQEILKKNNIKGIILDVDNTLIDYYKNMPEGTKNWCMKMQEQGIKFCIASNSNNKEKIKKVAEELNIPYIFFAN